MAGEIVTPSFTGSPWTLNLEEIKMGYGAQNVGFL